MPFVVSGRVQFNLSSATGFDHFAHAWTYAEIAHSLLDGKDPELELENLGIVSQGYASVRTTYSRDSLSA